MSEPLLSEVIAFVADFRGQRPERLSAATRLREDLGIDGFDAEDILIAYRERFGVDMTAFEYDRHFGPEAAWNPFSWLYWRLFRPERLRFDPVTIGHLVEAARCGRWEYPATPAV